MVFLIILSIQCHVLDSRAHASSPPPAKSRYACKHAACHRNRETKLSETGGEQAGEECAEHARQHTSAEVAPAVVASNCDTN